MDDGLMTGLCQKRTSVAVATRPPPRVAQIPLHRPTAAKKDKKRKIVSYQQRRHPETPQSNMRYCDLLRCPTYPWKRTLVEPVRMSAVCPEADSCTAQISRRIMVPISRALTRRWNGAATWRIELIVGACNDYGTYRCCWQSSSAGR